jgi:hypothetical protein
MQFQIQFLLFACFHRGMLPQMLRKVRELATAEFESAMEQKSHTENSIDGGVHDDQEAEELLCRSCSVPFVSNAFFSKRELLR